MKKNLFLSLLLFSSFAFLSCGENKDGSGDLLGTGGGGNVTFQISIVQDDRGNNLFGANPSAAVKITTILVNQAQIPVNETVTNPTPDEVIQPLEGGQYYGFFEVPQGAQTGQQWSFRFQGTLAQGGQAFNVTTNYTIQ
ncbi:MAG: hypothetical protein EHM47_06240 [Ignavibacteriales bacterium]|nr:MAG: hypothetical protein EHM47_06240 [Ignavibacteriales bacterium]